MPICAIIRKANNLDFGAISFALMIFEQATILSIILCYQTQVVNVYDLISTLLTIKK